MSWSGLRLALTLLTVIPVGRCGDGACRSPGHPAAKPPPMPLSRARAGAAMAWAPGVGLLLGGAAAAVLGLVARASRGTPAGALLASAASVAALALLTGGLHLDGLADTADGLGSRRPAAEALAIMKRSDTGPLGVATLVLTLLLQVAALAQAQAIGRGIPSVLASVVTGRLALTWACRRGVAAARGSGLGAAVAGTVHPALALALCAAALAAGAAAGWVFAAAIAAGLVAAHALAAHAAGRLGGITGDVLGALAETAATVCLLVAALG